MENIMDIMKVVFISAMPVLELRAGLPLAVLLGFSKRWAFFYGVLGNTLGLFIAFLLLDHLMPYLKKIKVVRRIYLYSTRKVRRRRRRYLKMRYWGLFFLVATPLPGTGAWTAALVSFLFRFDRQQSMLVIFFGILAVAAIILTVGIITIHGYQFIF